MPETALWSAENGFGSVIFQSEPLLVSRISGASFFFSSSFVIEFPSSFRIGGEVSAELAASALGLR